MILSQSDFNQWLNNMNGFQEGLLLITVGAIVTILSKYFHKDWKDQGYKPFKPFRREGKTQSEDNFVIIMHTRTLVGIYAGYIIILFGIFKILQHLNVFD